MAGLRPHLVSLTRCFSYDVTRIQAALRDALARIEFDLNAVSGKNVLLKPNMLGAYPPHRHVTTHPAFVEAVALLFKGHGAHVRVGDSSNGVYPVDEVWNVTGIRKAAELAGADIIPFERAGSIDRGGFRISKALLDIDLIVNLPKFKTHGLTILTMAVKNCYGCVPGMVKTDYHRQFPDRRSFSEGVLRIAQQIKPHLTIIDGIVGMEGNGPSAGKPVDVGLIIAGENMHAVDTVCCRLVGLEPSELETLDAAHRMKIFDPCADIHVMGESIESCMPKRFELPSTYVKKQLDWRISKAVLNFIWNNMRVQPVISPARCQRCGLCIQSCPVSAIGWPGKSAGRAPAVDEKTCIQCFCCHEVCPYAAIDLRRSRMARLAQWLGRRSARRVQT